MDAITAFMMQVRSALFGQESSQTEESREELVSKIKDKGALIDEAS